MAECRNNLLENSIKSNNKKTARCSVNDVAEAYPNFCNSSVLNCESLLKPVKARGIWNGEQIAMLKWLIKNGYDAHFAKRLVISAYKPELGNSYVMGRVIRSLSDDTPVVWEGELLTRNYVNPTFSKKVFVGGVPWDITEADLVNGFSEYGVSLIEWPRKSAAGNSHTNLSKAVGYVYIVFDEDDSIKRLLNDCARDCGSAGEYHFKLSARRGQESTEIRQVQIIPWVVSDSIYITDAATRTQCNKTVFVGALHGMLTAEMLYSIMNEIYGSVVFVCLDNDKFKYPIGSGRVSFSSEASFFQAVSDGFLVIKTSKFIKKIQIDPFLEYAKCSRCFIEEGTYFCRNRSCFNYFCGKCWEYHHGLTKFIGPHVAVVRQPKKTPLNPNDASRRTKISLSEFWQYFDKSQFSPLWSSESLIPLDDIPLVVPHSSGVKQDSYKSLRKRMQTLPRKVRLPIKSSFCSVDTSSRSSVPDISDTPDAGKSQETGSNKSSDSNSLD